MTDATASSSPPQIVARDLTKTYRMGDSVIGALQGINVEVARGEYLAVTGHSGSGKSTFMNLIGALDTPTSGSLKIEGSELSGLSSDALAQYRNEKIGFVFQTFNLLARTSALDNVALPIVYSHRAGKGDAREKARACLARVGLAERERHQPSELRPESSRPSILSEPEVGVSSAPIRFMKVDLPEPEWPVTARYSPPATSTLMPCSAPMTLPPMR
jgi:predicted ABC-type transport system involved in lysophospholipase L1 biosynthesis ATPase subunit